jgi:hypothetical protein
MEYICSVYYAVNHFVVTGKPYYFRQKKREIEVEEIAANISIQTAEI